MLKPVTQKHTVPLALNSYPLPQTPTAHEREFDVIGPYGTDVLKPSARFPIINGSVTVTPAG